MTTKVTMKPAKSYTRLLCVTSSITSDTAMTKSDRYIPMTIETPTTKVASPTPYGVMGGILE